MLTDLRFKIQGGGRKQCWSIINEQVKTEQVWLIVVNDVVNNSLLEQFNKQVNVVLVGRKEGSRNPAPIIRLSWLFLLIRPDIIHCHHHSLIRIIPFRKKSVLTVHDVNIPVSDFKSFKKIFAISNTVKLDIEKRSDIKPIMIYNGIRVDEIRQKENYEFDLYKIVQVSRLDHKKKGQHILLKAIDILVNERNIQNIYVDFIGDGKSCRLFQKTCSWISSY